MSFFLRTNFFRPSTRPAVPLTYPQEQKIGQKRVTTIRSRPIERGSGMDGTLRIEADKLVVEKGTQLCRSRTLRETPEDERLVARAVVQAKAGDSEAIRYLYLRYASHVYGYVRSIVHDDHEAEDITQHVFAKLITVINRYEQRAVPFSRWMLRLAHNAAIDHLRSRRMTPCEDIRADETVEEGREDDLRSLMGALAILSEEQRNVVLLRHVVGLSPPEIAEHLGRSESSIHGLHYRARGAMQAYLVRAGAGPTIALAGA